MREECLARRYKLSQRTLIQEMDRALSLVGGRFPAAAKLLDMEPTRFRNFVNYYPQLKTKWGHVRRGRPWRSLGFSIRPFTPGVDRSLRRIPDGVRSVLPHLPRETQVEVFEFLKSLIENQEPEKKMI